MHTPSTWRYINKGLLIILSVLVLATITSIVFLSYTLLKLESLTVESGRDNNTALLLQDLFISLEDAESEVRGYVITGDAQYLTPYNQALQRIPANLAALRSDGSHDLTSQQIQKLTSLSDAKIAVMKQTVAARRDQDEESARQIMYTGKGGQITEEIRREISSVSASSLKDLRRGQTQSRSNVRAALWVAGAVSVFVLGICATLIWYFKRTILHERALESTKNEFLSLASHQLRTPATNVKQYVGMLLDGYLGDLSDKQHRALTIAYRNNESEIRIMNDLLDVARLDLKRIQLHKQPVNIVPIVKQVVKNYKMYTAERGQTLTLKAPPELIAPVDREYFKGVVENLVDNAVKYSRDNTRITVRIRADVERGRFEIIVKDQGLGIKKREISKLFMKFSRLTNEFSANTEGSGLGLYWVKQIMALHGGSVEAVSKEGQGSEFTVRLPLR